MTDEEQKLIRFQTAVDARSREIALFWQRAVFFWGFTAAAFVGVATALEKHPRLALLLSCFGLVCSVCWSLANRGSKYWYEAWEMKVQREEDSIGGALFSKIEPLKADSFWLSARRYSVSKLAIILSDYVCLIWVSIIAWLLGVVIRWQRLSDSWRDLLTLVFIAATVVFIILAFTVPKSNVPEREKDDG